MPARWSGPFTTPNVAGMEIAIIGLALLAMSEAVRDRFGFKCSLLVWLLFIGVCLLEAATQSRAGLLALIGGIIFLAISHGTRWRCAIIGCGITIGTSLAWPGVVGRVLSTVNDSSIMDRLVLWKSTLALIGDHPLTGVGAGSRVEIMEAWYLPDQYAGRFCTALNDSLTLASSYGLGSFLFLFWLIVIPIAAVLAGSSRRNRFFSLISALVVVHFVSGCFQAHAWTLSGMISGGITLLLAITCSIVIFRRNPMIIRPTLGRSAMTASACTIILLLAALFFSSSSPVRTRYIEGRITASNRNSIAVGNIIFAAPTKRLLAALRRWRTSLLSSNAEIDLLGISLDAFPDCPSLSRCGAMIAIEEAAGPIAVLGSRQDKVIPILVIDPVALPPPEWISNQAPMTWLVGSSAAFLPSLNESGTIEVIRSPGVVATPEHSGDKLCQWLLEKLKHRSSNGFQ
jgi:hypothetical protein